VSNQPSTKIEIKSAPSARKVILTSFLTNFFDIALSLAVTLLSGSVVMLSQFFQAAADITASGLLVLGINQSKKGPDRKHPFGHGRETYFWALISALIMLGGTSTLSIFLGVQRILHPEPITNIVLALGVLVFTLTTNLYSLSLSYKRLFTGETLRTFPRAFFYSPLIETKTAFVLDLMATSASMLGFISLLLLQLTGNNQLDGVGALLIGISMASLAFILLKGVKELLVGRSAEPQVEENIRTAAKTLPEVKDILDLRTMHIGPEKLLVNLEVHLEDDLDTDEIEKLIDRIKQVVQTKEPTVHHIQVELETPE
jgi:cation diffusion facilitator family transporter